MSLSKVFSEAKIKGEKILIPYITAGDPNWEASFELAMAFYDIGIRVIELGIPFSDPVADGPTNQRAAERALAAGTTLGSVLNGVAQLKKAAPELEVICFSYLNPIYKMGYQKFVTRADQVGLAGCLIVDLPPEEASDYLAITKKASLETIFLASPTTDKSRLKLIDDCSSGFVYYVSRTGVTGAKATLSQSLPKEISELRGAISSPIAVGFGISTPSQAKAVAVTCDAVVVGSAIVKQLAGPAPFENKLTGVIEFTKSLMQAIKSV